VLFAKAVSSCDGLTCSGAIGVGLDVFADAMGSRLLDTALIEVVPVQYVEADGSEQLPSFPWPCDTGKKCRNITMVMSCAMRHSIVRRQTNSSRTTEVRWRGVSASCMGAWTRHIFATFLVHEQAVECRGANG
jgi:hypothetical protein